jgi:hypothetical protein
MAIKLVFDASPLSRQLKGVGDDWFGIGIMSPCGVTWLTVDCCFNGLVL